MRLTATEMSQQSAQKAYYEASKGEVVEIMHGRYPDMVFELTARYKEPLKEVELMEFSKAIKINETAALNAITPNLYAEIEKSGVKIDVPHTYKEKENES